MNKLHFQEIDFALYFPAHGNEGRPLGKYGVAYLDRRRGMTQEGRRINLTDVLRLPQIHTRYPHTVGWYQSSSGKGRNWRPVYIEVRTVPDEAGLLAWIATIEGMPNARYTEAERSRVWRLFVPE